MTPRASPPGSMPAARARTALVTGASRGIGQAIAERLLADGWSVRGTYRSGAAEIAALTAKWPGLTAHRVDLGDDDQVDALIAALRGSRLDALVNNAGVIHFENVEDFDPVAWRETFEVNLIAPVRLAAALEAELRGGAVVNVASTDGLVGSYNSLAYAASKAALINVTKSLGNVLARSAIRVNAVTPGWIATDMTSEEELAAEHTPLGRLGTPGEVAAAVAWLLDPQASFVTGASVVIDGGYSNVDVVMKEEAREREQ
jgi:NAD(P)-dependent dehydrogenase (short-subunit alcohol dehydrogenase family)